MVERWHRTLKVAIMCHSNATWYQSLPTVLLGLRTTFHDDLKVTSAKLVFGEKLRLPGDFLHDSKLASPSTFVQKLRNAFADLRPVLPSHHTKQKPFIFRFLSSCTHVFVHTDFVRTSLQPPYEGPYPVIMRYAKYLVIGMKGVSRTISIDRLKSCFFADPDPSKPTLDDKSSTTSTSPSTVPDTPHHSQQSTSEQPSKLRVRFAEPPAQYVTRSGRAIQPSRLFL
ncbi:putative gag-pol protein [Trichonephila inaurata madagascariensis]|uniref:Putative gag-pol protein n=1 Tax=Trichonephila inaurata madagascariensis TaxID=2747483 RepID=A0A8X6X1H4_9ARAC|nr:putative gag-pol protein [Trichonephila inaurata madagascariensis]